MTYKKSRRWLQEVVKDELLLKSRGFREMVEHNTSSVLNAVASVAANHLESGGAGQDELGKAPAGPSRPDIAMVHQKIMESRLLLWGAGAAGGPGRSWPRGEAVGDRPQVASGVASGKGESLAPRTPSAAL